MTKENLDSQFERDSTKWERKRATYQQAAQSPAHNHGPGTKSLLEQGHIASRGKGKGIPQSSYEPSLLLGIKSSDRPCSAPPQRPNFNESSISVRQKLSFNPILQDQFEEPPIAHHQKALVSRPTSARSFNPILGQYKDGEPTVPERPHTPGRGKARVEAGISWGSRNPLTQEWSHPPVDPLFREQEELANRQWGINGRQKRHVPQGVNRDQGLYNPVTNVWIIPPVNPRIAEGLHFHTPTTFFSPARP